MARTQRPVTDEDRQAVRRLHAEGKSLRAIAKELDRSPVTIGSIAKAAGLAFDTRPTAAAVQAKVQDNRARRAALVSSLYDIAEDDVRYLKQPGAYGLTEVSAGQAVDFMVDRLPAADRRALIGAISTAAKTALDLERIDSDEQGLPAVDMWLRTVLGGGDS